MASPFQLGSGDFIWSQVVSERIEQLRFLDAVAAQFPRKLASLRRCPKPVYGNDANQIRARYHPQLAALTFLRRWVRRHYLGEDWVLAIAAATADALHRDQVPAGCWAAAAELVQEVATPVPAAPIEPPDPIHETRRQWMTRAAAQSSEQWELSVRRLEETGACRTPNRLPKHGHDPYVWLARRQVGNETPTTIAKTDGVMRQAVEASNAELAARIGLPLRPPNRNRKKR